MNGDCTQHLLWRLKHIEGHKMNPKLAIIMIGQNNGPYNTHEEISNGVITIVEYLRKVLPAMEILLIAIFQRGSKPNPERKTVPCNEITSEIKCLTKYLCILAKHGE